MIKLWAVILGTMWLGGLSVMAFMLAAFAGGGYGNGKNLTPLFGKFLNISIFVLPGSCLLALIMLWVAFIHGWGVLHYWWMGFPLIFVMGYCVVLYRGRPE